MTYTPESPFKPTDGIIFSGTWVPNSRYWAPQAVTYEGDVWLAKDTVTVGLPPVEGDEWTLFASGAK
jgi:hypothetical protein